MVIILTYYSFLELGSGLSDAVSYANVLLCLVLAVMIVLHLINLICCGPRLAQRMFFQKQATGSKAVAGGVTVMPEDDELPCCLSDFTLAAALANQM